MEQLRHQIPPETQQTSPEKNNYEQFHGTPPSPKKRNETTKDPTFLSSPIYPPILHS